MRDFFAFRTMISAGLIKVVYPLGALGILALAGWGVCFAPAATSASGLSAVGSGQLTVVQGVTLALVGNLFWRIVCEQVMLFFAIHAALVKNGSEH